MRKTVLLLAVMCLLLAGCAEQSDKFAHGEAGNYYNEFISDGSQPDSYIVTAEAHVDDVLSLLYINTAAETGLGFELKLESCDGDIMLYRVGEDGAEYPVAGTPDKTGINMPYTFRTGLTLPEGQSRLEWRSENGAVLQFKLTLSGVEDIDISMSNWDELPEVDDLPEIKPEDKPEDEPQTGGQINM